MKSFDAISTINSKNANLGKKIPKFMYPIIRKILAEKQVNKLFNDAKGRSGLELVKWILEDLDITVKVQKPANFDPKEKMVYCANHPTGGIDGIVLISVLADLHPDIILPVNDLLISLPGLGEFFFPLNMYADNRQRLRQIDSLYQSDRTIAIFPSGKTARLKDGVVTDLPWTKSFLKKARLSKRAITPIHLSGRNSKRFYRIWKLRTFFGIKINFEMFLLIDELFRLRGSEISVVIGNPVSLAELPVDDTKAVPLLKKLTEDLGNKDNKYDNSDRAS